MDSSPPRPLNNLFSTLAYFSAFQYPLTAEELWFWQSGRLSLTRITALLKNYPHTKLGFYYLSGQDSTVDLRKNRLASSYYKKNLALKTSRIIRFIPWVHAIFITGSLAMDNSPKNDDIDLMVITHPHTLWFTRLLVVITLKIFHLRRPGRLPEHSSARVQNKICDNLWLDTDHLALSACNLYTAHEILQAKCIFDRGGIHRLFLTQNPWVRNYLPVAYFQILKNCSNDQLIKPTVNRQLPIVKSLLWLINLLSFWVQYLYMRPKITTEKIGLGYAFFHPGSKQ